MSETVPQASMCSIQAALPKTASTVSDALSIERVLSKLCSFSPHSLLCVTLILCQENEVRAHAELLFIVLRASGLCQKPHVYLTLIQVLPAALLFSCEPPIVYSPPIIHVF